MLARGLGRELGGKILQPHSSAALAANTFGPFLEAPERLILAGRAGFRSLELESEARFPWARGRHPQLDLLAVTDQELIGVESKLLEPWYWKAGTFSPTYDRPVWEELGLGRWAALEDELRAGPIVFETLDAVQLTKHALGLATQARVRGLRPLLVCLSWRPMSLDPVAYRHAAEIAQLVAWVSGDGLGFEPYRHDQLWAEWEDSGDEFLVSHAARLRARYELG